MHKAIFEDIRKTIFNHFINKNERTRTFDIDLDNNKSVSLSRGNILVNYHSELTSRKFKFYKELCKGIHDYHDYVLSTIEPNKDILSPYSKKIFEELSNSFDFFDFPPPPPPPAF